MTYPGYPLAVWDDCAVAGSATPRLWTFSDLIGFDPSRRCVL
jgi:hypothetical protein